MNIELLALYKTLIFSGGIGAFLFATWLFVSSLIDDRYNLLKFICGVLVSIGLIYLVVLNELNRELGYCEQGFTSFCERLQ